MFSDRIKKALKPIGVRLTFWYCGFFILGTVVVLSLAYYFLSTSLEQKDREIIRAKVSQYTSLYKQDGTTGLQKFLSGAGRADAQKFLIRIEGGGGSTLLQNLPNHLEDFDISGIEKQLSDPRRSKAWMSVQAKDDEDALEILNTDMGKGVILQVGESTQDRENLLETFLNVFLLITFPIVGIGFLSGYLLSRRALNPIRHLVATIKTIHAGDVSARVALRGSGDELDELGLLFNQMFEKVQALIQGMRGTLDNVAHDLRTPMTRFRCLAEAALQSESGQNQKEALGECMECSDEILILLNALMDLSEAETGTIKLKLEVLNMSELAAQALDLYRFVAEEKQISLTANFEGPIMITADRVRLGQALANLFDNAIKYTQPGGAVTASTSTSGNSVRFVLQDTGIGIPKLDHGRIWDRLYRGDQSRSEKGLGLGLSLVKAIVRAHRGTIELTSDTGRGSSFTLILPINKR